MSTVVVIGDVGGHPDELGRALASVGMVGGRLPADVIVVQVGDLVDRGPDSRSVVRMVAHYLSEQPQQWVQLIGNHETQYLPGHERFWPDSLGDDAGLLISWWERGAMNVAAALRTAEGEEFLITHAGLSVPLWRMLDEPMTATTAAHLLNDRPQLLINDEAGPLWARNLHEPWLDYYAAGGFVPFGQIHGHSAIVSYAEGTFTCPGKVRQRATVDWERRQVRVRVGGRVFIGVDPKHGEAGAPTWAPLVLPGATLLG